MYRTFPASRLAAAEFALIKPQERIAEQFGALRAKLSVALLVPAIHPHNQLYGNFFFFNAIAHRF